MSKLLSLRLAPVPTSVAAAREAVTEVCGGLGLCQEVTESVRLAVTEACTNVVLHAYGRDAASAVYTLEATVDRSALLVTVRDTGAGMPPMGSGATRNAGLGLGLQLMARTAASVDVVSRAGHGTRIALRFSIESSPPVLDA